MQKKSRMEKKLLIQVASGISKMYFYGTEASLQCCYES